MPFIKLQTSVSLAEDKQGPLLESLSKILVNGIGKPEQYVMAVIEDNTPIIMSGKHDPAAFADIRSIGGLNGKVNARLAQHLCTLLDQSLGISPDRVYINFSNVSAGDWGWKGGTFG